MPRSIGAVAGTHGRRPGLLVLGTAVIVTAHALFAVGSARAIVGGSPDGSGHPNVAAIVYEGGFVGCTGFLVAPRVVVTAAHCIGVYDFLGFHPSDVSFAPTVDVTSTIDATLWPRIFAANVDQITDPNLIFPGQVFRIPQ